MDSHPIAFPILGPRWPNDRFSRVCLEMDQEAELNGKLKHNLGKSENGLYAVCIQHYTLIYRSVQQRRD
uniref:Uncharacterized protein n=1 Tax=Solanum tuberosum TaxID=4113 RepID=M1CNQ9_SOLTU